MTEYINFWKNYANFTARTTRRGYWMYFLINFLIGILLIFLPNFISTLYSLAILVPSLAIMVRRCRDAGKHWLNLLIPMVGAFVGVIIIIAGLIGGVATGSGAAAGAGLIIGVLVLLVSAIWPFIITCLPSVAPDGTPVV